MGKDILLSSMKSMLETIDSGGLPSEDDCLSMKELLQTYLGELQKKTNSASVGVLFKDVSDRNVKTKDIVEDLSVDPDYLNVINDMAIKKMVMESDLQLSNSQRNDLIRKGYIASLEVEINGEKYYYYALTSKGWLCVKRNNVLLQLMKIHNKMYVPVLDFDFSETKLILYSFSDQAFYDCESLEQIAKEDIFTVTESSFDSNLDDEEEESIEEITEEEIDNEELSVADNTEDETEGLESPKIEATVSYASETVTNQSSEISIAEENIKDVGKSVNDQNAAATMPSEKVRDNVLSLLADKRFYAGAAYAKSCETIDKETKYLYDLVAYALNEPMAHCVYSTDNVFNLISRRSTFDDAMIVSTALRLFFSNKISYDYQIKPFYNGIKEFPVLSQFPSLSNVLYTLMEFKNELNKGMDAYAGYRAKSQAQLEKELKKLRADANVFYENFVNGRKKENASQKRFLETKKLMLSPSSDLGFYIKSIVDNDRDLYPLLSDFLKTEFIKDGDEISEDAINKDKVWDYIVAFWDKAGDKMMYKRHADLMSHLRTNITSTTMKAIQLLVRWCVLVEESGNHEEDEGTIAYKRKKGVLLSDIEKACEELGQYCLKTSSDEDKAGYQVLLYTLHEIQRCIDGSYDENEHKFFYVPFLLTDDIVLDENYYPDMDVHNTVLSSISVPYRIMEHVQKMKAQEITFDARLHEIFEEKGDDFGSAELIISYLSEVNPTVDYSEQLEKAESGISYAKDYTDNRKNDFVGDLELAQSYGQIDNSNENKKEAILKAVDDWYEWAVETSNYGFCRKVMDNFISEIRLEAKTREKDLLEQLETFRTAQFTGITSEAKDKRAKRIMEMIKAQNYTVAEDLLARASIVEDEYENIDVDDTDFLKDFLDNYEDYYKPVATRQANFSSLVSSRTRNKEERGAKRMADSWLPGGSKLGMDRLKVLMYSYGFKVGSVKDMSSTGKFENYIITTDVPKGGQRENFTHPIAAFGSGASQEGFRIVCVNGAYDADGLIDLMKQIGNSKHTLILHDYALTISERRRLARKTKNALGGKFFGVIDRTVMMYLVRHYDETKINRMLMTLIMPFGYYQPYVWESVNVMPPEIFMGRKIELEKIKSPTGVNIVYGGRQLGKSALLKKAKDDIDWDENGDRAVYIDIKDLNYEQAANKIGHELYDQFVLDYDIDTKDWDELSRVIRRRLQSGTSKPIPYLLLLLDEADAFIESCEAVNYKPLDALKDIQNIGANRFKFVVAGLRNIVRFKREVALGNNSVLTHLEALTVKPFDTTEARELMETPLYYLGLRFSKEKESQSLVTLILANTNYFPGLIQMYCAKLLEAMRKKDYAGYDENDTPIYEVSKAHIKKILADPEFMQQIREKFVITLKLDEDNYYYLIALLMAYLYHNNGYNEGYSAEDIHYAGSELDIRKISDLSITKLSALMEELRELNVLRSTDDTHYLFTRFTFFQMMGTSSEVEDKLTDYMED